MPGTEPMPSSFDLPTRATAKTEAAQEFVDARVHEAEQEKARTAIQEHAQNTITRVEETIAEIRDAMDAGYTYDDAWKYMHRLTGTRASLEDEEDALSHIQNADVDSLRREVRDLSEAIRELAGEIQRQFPKERKGDTALRVAAAHGYAADEAKVRQIRQALAGERQPLTEMQRKATADRIRDRLAQLEAAMPEKDHEQAHMEAIVTLRDTLNALEEAAETGVMHAVPERSSAEQQLAKAAKAVEKAYGKPPEKLTSFEITTRRALAALMGLFTEETDPLPVWQRLRDQHGDIPSEAEMEMEGDETNELHERRLPRPLRIAEDNQTPPRPDNDNVKSSRRRRAA